MAHLDQRVNAGTSLVITWEPGMRRVYSLPRIWSSYSDIEANLSDLCHP